MITRMYLNLWCKSILRVQYFLKHSAPQILSQVIEIPTKGPCNINMFLFKVQIKNPFLKTMLTMKKESANAKRKIKLSQSSMSRSERIFLKYYLETKRTITQKHKRDDVLKWTNVDNVKISIIALRVHRKHHFFFFHIIWYFTGTAKRKKSKNLKIFSIPYCMLQSTRQQSNKIDHQWMSMLNFTPNAAFFS